MKKDSLFSFLKKLKRTIVQSNLESDHRLEGEGCTVDVLAASSVTVRENSYTPVLA